MPRRVNKWLVLLAASLGLFMVIIDNTVVNVSIPSMITELKADLSQVEWVLNAYALSFAALLITFGRLGDMFGRRRVFVIGLVLFGVGSAACGLAPSAPALIAFRVFQSFGAACMLPATLSLVSVNFPPAERGTAFGVWGAVSGFAVGIGPTLGGLLTQYSWRYVFFINVPIVVGAIALTLLVVPESKDAGEQRIDWVGVVLSIAFLLAFNYGMIQGPRRNWDALIVGLLVLSAVLFAAFLYWERRARQPLVELDLWRNRTYVSGNMVAMQLLFVMFGVFFLLPLFLQTVLGYTPLRTGLVIAPMSVVLMLIGPVAGRLSDRWGPRWLMFGGLMAIAVGVFWISFLSEEMAPADLIPRFVLMGAGMGVTISPMTSAVMGSVPPERAGGASGVLSTTRQVGAVMGIAILGAVLQGQMAANLIENLAAIPGVSFGQAQRIVQLERSSSQGLVGGGASAAAATPAGVLGAAEASQIRGALRGAYREAFVQSLSATFRVGSIIAFAAALTALGVCPRLGKRAGPVTEAG